MAHRALRLGLSSGGKLLTITDGQGAPTAVVSTSFNVGLNYGLSATHQDFADINGDGLPDHVRRTPAGDAVSVRLNLGYGFTSEIPWSTTGWSAAVARVGHVEDVFQAGPSSFGDPVKSDVVRLQDQSTWGLGAGGGVSGVGAGGGIAEGLGRSLVDLVDVNGDGLADQVLKEPGDNLGSAFSRLHIKFNQGARFGDEQIWQVPNWPQDLGWFFPGGDRFDRDALSFNHSRNLQGSISLRVCFILCVGGSVFYSRGGGHSSLSFDDVNGDGHVDHVLKLDGDANVYAKLNLTGKVNRLRAVQGPLGGSFVLDYRPEGNVVLTGQDQLGQPRTVDMSSTQWVLASVDSFDGQTDPQPAMRSEFDYRIRMTEGSQPVDVPSGVFDRVERENLGFAHVQTRRKAASPAEELVVDQFFHNQTERPQTDRLANYALKGLPFRVEERNGEGKLFRLVTINYQPTPVLDAQGTTVPTVFFPQERRRETALFEGTLLSPDVAVAVRQVEERQFDADGNLITFRDIGDPTDPGDDVVHTISYDPRASLRDRHIFKPTSVNAVDAAGTLLRRREATYGPDRGELLGMVMVLQGGNDPTTGRPRTGAGGTNPFWSFEWDEFGNLIRYVDPTGYVIAYEYDNEVRTHRISARDAFGYVSQTQPNLRFGAVDEIIDINNQKTVFRHDEFGRTHPDVRPRQELPRSVTPTIRWSIRCPCGHRPAPAHALVRHLDCKRPRGHHRHASFVDGLSRVIQTKKDLDDSRWAAATSRKSVSGKVIFDDLGRPKTRASPSSTSAPHAVRGRGRGPEPDSLELRRPVAAAERSRRRRQPSHSPLRFGRVRGRNRLLVRSPTPTARAARPSAACSDEVLAVEEFNTSGPAQLTTLLTRYSTTRCRNCCWCATPRTTSPGRSTTASARWSRSTTRTRADGVPLRPGRQSGVQADRRAARAEEGDQLHLPFNRLERIDYPFSPDVTYIYGISGAPFNRAGRIAHVTDESGIEQRMYGSLGETGALGAHAERRRGLLEPAHPLHQHLRVRQLQPHAVDDLPRRRGPHLRLRRRRPGQERYRREARQPGYAQDDRLREAGGLRRVRAARAHRLRQRRGHTIRLRPPHAPTEGGEQRSPGARRRRGHRRQRGLPAPALRLRSGRQHPRPAQRTGDPRAHRQDRPARPGGAGVPVRRPLPADQRHRKASAEGRARASLHAGRGLRRAQQHHPEGPAGRPKIETASGRTTTREQA